LVEGKLTNEMVVMARIAVLTTAIARPPFYEAERTEISPCRSLSVSPSQLGLGVAAAYYIDAEIL
jgi:hypothetical protein